MKNFSTNLFWRTYPLLRRLGLLVIYLIFAIYIIHITIDATALGAKLIYAIGGGIVLCGALYYEYLKILYTKMTTALTMQTDIFAAKKARAELLKRDVFKGFKGSLIIFDSLLLMDEGKYEACLAHMEKHRKFFFGTPDYLFIYWHNRLLCHYFLDQPAEMLKCGQKLAEFKQSDQRKFSPLFSFDEIDGLIASVNGLHQKAIRCLDKLSVERLNARERSYYYYMLATEYRALNDQQQVGKYLKLTREYQNTLTFG